MNEPKKLLLVGCGKMGGALLQGWIEQRVLLNIELFCVTPHPEKHKFPHVVFWSSLDQAIHYTFDYIVFAIKPQKAEEIIPSYHFLANKNTCIISIMAGVSLDRLKALIPQAVNWVRFMPNLAVSLGEGMSFLVGKTQLSQMVIPLFSPFGAMIVSEDEGKIDAFTALCGSGPAYYFYMVELFEAIAKDYGFDQTESELLARQTIIGASALLKQHPEITVQAWRDSVTSPQGTTAAALSVLQEQNHLHTLLQRAIKKAITRAYEMGIAGSK